MSDTIDTAPETVRSAGEPEAYRVLARKYRPTDFDSLIGQEAMVRTLRNAIASGRLAQAFMLTGVRGVGKTTTARIIARALNCVGPDGAGGPTVNPCGVCPNCAAIAEDRHVDVLEMDAASHNGVDGIRDLIDGVRYRPTMGRYKVYILDEVHMLSTAAFNALLKTLEEPPEHVKFIFATTEIRKVPVTVLSRCQRFDLRRVDADRLVEHFGLIAEKEGATVEPGALALLARAADGSVRDGLSLLDQAIAHGGGIVTEEQVRDMLGLADRAVVFDLFDAVMRGDVKAALDLVADQYRAGADPLVVLQDLLELTHWLTRLKLVPEAAGSAAASETERTRGRAMAERLAMPVLARAWQMLLKGLNEARAAPSSLQAAEMTLVRLAFVADLPTPADAVKAVTEGGPRPTGSQGAAPGGGGGGGPVAVARSQLRTVEGPAAVRMAAPEAAPGAVPSDAGPATFEALVDLTAEKREALLHANLFGNVHLVRFESGHIEFRPGPNAPADLAPKLSGFLQDLTGRRWVVSVSREPGAPTLLEQSRAREAARKDVAAQHPLVQAVLETFPGAAITRVIDLESADEPTDGDDVEAIAAADTRIIDGDDET